jgi:hypothetical protein
MRLIIKLLIMVVVGFVFGYLVIAAALLLEVSDVVVYNSNSWKTVKGIGSPDANALTRAVIAKIGLFANSKEEAIYFAAYPGKPDEDMCGDRHYRIISRKPIATAWWSITLYNDRRFLFDNEENRYSFTTFNVVRERDGSFVIDVAPSKPQGAKNWLPAPKGERFHVILRVYHPAPELYENIEAYPLPVVREVK